MGQPAAKKGDKVQATDTHMVIVPGTPPITATLPHPFSGMLDNGLSTDVNIMGQPAATVDSTATNSPAHTPTAPGNAFSKPPTNLGTVKLGSTTVFINGKAAARNGDKVETCNDPANLPIGMIIATGTVLIG